MAFELGAWKSATRQKASTLWGGDLQRKSKKAHSTEEAYSGSAQHPKERDRKEEKGEAIPFEAGIRKAGRSNRILWWPGGTPVNLLKESASSFMKWGYDTLENCYSVR